MGLSLLERLCPNRRGPPVAGPSGLGQPAFLDFYPGPVPPVGLDLQVEFTLSSLFLYYQHSKWRSSRE